MLTIMKFGGSSVANAEKLQNVAGRVADCVSSGSKVIVVVSAQGDTTDDLIEKAAEINENPSKREMDVLLSAGEQISMALLAMALEKMKLPVVSLTGWQAEIFTNANYSGAKVERIIGERIRKELDANRIIIVAGFQGIDKYDNITTLGRGGSDTTAVALAAALNADICEIYTDVDGVYTADPRIVKDAHKLNDISYDEMLELASLGANVLHNRSVEMALKYNVTMEVKSSFNKVNGTKIKEVTKVEKMLVRGVTRDNDVALITVKGIDQKQKPFDVFKLLAKNNISVDIILLGENKVSGKDLTFTVAKKDEMAALEIVKEDLDFLTAKSVESDSNVSKVSIVGAGMTTNSGVASMAFEALVDNNIDIKLITTSEISVSMVVEEKDAEKAVVALHEKFL